MNKSLFLIFCLIGPLTPLLAQTSNLVTSQIAHRSPVDVALARKKGYLVTANELSNSVSLISLSNKRVLDECTVGEHPAYIEVTDDEKFVLVSCTHSSELVKLEIIGERLVEVARSKVGYEPVGFALENDTNKLYVGRTANGTVAEVDLETLNTIRVFEVGNWPRYLTLSRDGKRLAVGLSGDSRIAVLDVASGRKLSFSDLNTSCA